MKKNKAWLITQFNKILDWLGSQVKKLRPNSKLRSKLLKLIARCKAGLAKSKSLNAQNKELADKLKQEVEELNEESLTLNEQLERELGEVDKVYDEMQREYNAVHKPEDFIELTNSNLESARDAYLKMGKRKQANDIDKILNTKNMGLRSLMIRKFNINYHPGNANEIMHNLDILVQKSNAYADVARKMSRK